MGAGLMLLNILVLVAMWAVGSFIYSIGVMQILLVMFCAVPLTKDLIKNGYHVNKSGMYNSFSKTIIFWLVIILGISIPIFLFGNLYVKCGYLIGIGVAFLISLGKWGRTEQNVSDFFSTYSRFIPDIRIQSQLMDNILNDLTTYIEKAENEAKDKARKS